MNKRLSLIIGGVLAILAVILVRAYLNQQREVIRSQEEKKIVQMQESQVSVLIAKQDISPGTAINPSMVDIAVAPTSQVPPQTASSYEQLLNKEAAAPIAKGEPLMLSKLTSSRRPVAKSVYSLAGTTPVGKRAITIPVDNISSVGGMIKPGDYVDVLCSISVPAELSETKKDKKQVILPLFQNVLVLAVGSEIAAEEEDVSRYAQEDKAQKQTTPPKTITLALAPKEVNLIAFAQEQGKIQMVLRPQGDTQIETIQPASWDTIFKYFMSEKMSKEEKGVDSIMPLDKVEIYRGLKREVVPLSK